jgi:tRNA (guanine-N7-)-methyltransferase
MTLLPSATPKKLKPSQHRITLFDGRELQYHPPFRKSEPLRLADMLPADRSSTLEVEIGPGKGEFLSRRAAAHPDRFFVGIDRRLDRMTLTQRKLERNPSGKNWLVLQQDARSFLEAGLPPISALHVYHPDPWPKAKHHKHRFFRSPDARRWVEAIVPGGELRLSTDHREYFEEIIDIVASWGLVKNTLAFKKTAPIGDAVTHFEGIFLRKSEPVYKAFFIRL